LVLDYQFLNYTLELEVIELCAVVAVVVIVVVVVDPFVVVIVVQGDLIIFLFFLVKLNFLVVLSVDFLLIVI
jgi:hypothetical protein